MALDTIRELLDDDERYYEEVKNVSHDWNGRIFSVETLDVQLSDGSTGWREIVRHNGGAGVCAILDGKICLVRQYRVALGRMTLEIPAGKLDPNEDPQICAAREFEEETGYTASSFAPLVVTAGSPGFNNERTRVFVARGLRRGDARPDDGELVDVVWLPVEDVLEAVQAGLIEDAKTVVSVLAAAAGLA